MDQIKELLEQGRYDVNEVNDDATPLQEACKKGHIDVAKALIGQFKADMTIQNKEGATAIMIAIERGHDNVAHALLEDYQCPVDIRDKDGDTALHYACRANATLSMKTLLQKYNAENFLEDSHSDKSLKVFLVARSGDVDKVKRVLKSTNLNISVTDSWNWTPLHFACRWGDFNMARMLTQTFGADLTTQNRNGDTPLNLALKHGHDKVAHALLECSVDVRDKDGKTRLHYVCAEGKLNLARTLIAHKVNMTIQDRDGATALMLAIKHGHDNVAHTLLEDYQCPVDIRDKDGNTVLHYACRANATLSVKTLIQKYNVDMYSRNDNNDMPLHVAATDDSQEVVLALVQEFCCDVNIKGCLGRSALHSACTEGHVDMVKCLSNYISLLVVDDYGNTPLHTCCEFGNTDCVEALLSLNAPVLARNNYGKIPKDIAEAVQNYSIKELVVQHMSDSTFHIHYDTFQKLAKKRYSSSEHITRIFVLGNPGAGKSSFIATLKREGFFESLRRVSESSVPPHTAGIVPSIHTSKHYGRVLFYDFAGDAEYYSSHAAILENLACTSKGDNIFIIVVDLREDSHKISCLLNYWVSFIQCQIFKERKPQLVILGSHLDLVKSYTLDKFEKLCISGDLKPSGCFMLDCCKPKSKELSSIVQHITTLVKDSPHYVLSNEAAVLLGLLGKDFQHVIACPIQSLISHIEDTKIPLPTDEQSLCAILFELHELGLLFLIKGDNDVQLVLNMSRLSHDVHQLLFSEEAVESLREKSLNASLFHVGIISEAVLLEVLPAHITKAILIQLQYCQVIHHKDVGTFSSSDQCDSSVQSYLFFPALCSAEKSDIAWVTPPDLSYGIGWLARCTDPRDYFPPRFHHVLLLRLVFNFILSDSPTNTPLGASPDRKYFPHYCRMWKTGVYWITEEGVRCVVELINGSTDVVVLTKADEDLTDQCVQVFTNIVSCVMEAKAEFCHSIRPEFFLLDSTDESDYLSVDNLFAMEMIEKALASPQGEGVISVTRNRRMKQECLLFLHRFSLWHSLFPIDTVSVLKCLENVSQDLCTFGVNLDLSAGILYAIENDYPNNTERQRIELVRRWLNSSLDPCWWHLAQALRQIQEEVLAEEIERNESK